jgi:serine/threonine protein kinase
MTPLPPDSHFPAYGSTIGAWIVQERIGSGSHGVVFRALRADKQDGKSYALKLALQKNDARMEREVRLLSRVRHASVPRLEGSGLWTSPRGDTYPYLVMEWVEGVSLYKWAEEHGLTLRQAIGQLAQVARALEATHRHGVHRDVKGDNVLVNAQGRAVLLDFGSCWYQGARPLTDGALPPATEQYRSHQLLFFRYALSWGAKGYYEAPPADDVYALGITAYRLLAGDYPPRAGEPEDEEEEASKPVPLEAPRGLAEKCPELSALIQRMLSEDPEARGSARQVAEELERLREASRPALDEWWVPRTSPPPTEETRRPHPPRPEVRTEQVPWLASAGVVIMLVLLVVLLVVLLMPSVDRPEGGYAEAEQNEQPVTEQPDAGTGMGNEATASVKSAGAAPISGRAITREVPERPFSGLVRPPCAPWGAVEINGGCWRIPLGAEKAPCYKDLYEHQGRCYDPVLLTERQPTSDDP